MIRQKATDYVDTADRQPENPEGVLIEETITTPYVCPSFLNANEAGTGSEIIKYDSDRFIPARLRCPN